MKITNKFGLGTYGVRALIYFVLVFLFYVNKPLFTGEVVLVIMLALFIYVMSTLFSRTIHLLIQYLAVFEAAITVIIFVGDRFGLPIDFFLGLFFLAGFNLAIVLGILAENKQRQE